MLDKGLAHATGGLSWGKRTQDEREPGEDDGREQEADGASAKLLHEEQDGDDHARQPNNERCGSMHRASNDAGTEQDGPGLVQHAMPGRRKMHKPGLPRAASALHSAPG